MGIYTITCGTGVYVGKSKYIKRRWNHHKQALRGGNHINPRLQLAYKENGGKFEVIEVVKDPAQLHEREAHWIKKVGTLNIAGVDQGWVFKASPIVVDGAFEYRTQREFADAFGFTPMSVSRACSTGALLEGYKVRHKNPAEDQQALYDLVDNDPEYLEDNDPGYYPEEERSEILEAMNKAMEHMTDKQREVMDMLYNYGMTFKEVAETLGVSVQSIQHHRDRSLPHLRRLLLG